MENLKNMMGIAVISTEEYSLLYEKKIKIEAVERIVEANKKETFVYVRDIAAVLGIDITPSSDVPVNKEEE